MMIMIMIMIMIIIIIIIIIMITIISSRIFYIVTAKCTFLPPTVVFGQKLTPK